MANVVEDVIEAIGERSLRVKRYLPRRIVREQLHNDEFRYAADALKADADILHEADEQAEAIWMRTTRAREEAIETSITYSFPLVLLAFGFFYGAQFALGWLDENWPKSDIAIAHMPSELLRSALSDWRGLGSPDRWVYLYGAVALPLLARLIITNALYFIPLEWELLRARTAGEVVPAIRVALNKIANEKFPLELLVTGAPGLGEISSPQRLVIRDELRRIRLWGEELGAPAIAISGARGVGKTTLLKSMFDPSYREQSENGADVLPVFVAAPVSYDAREFLLLLYSELCRAVLEFTGRKSGRTPILIRRLTWRVLRGVRRIVGLSLVLLVGLAAIPFISTSVKSWMTERSWPILDSLWGLAFLAVATYMVWLPIGAVLPNPTRIFSAPPFIAQKAEAELRKLHYLQTLANESTGGIKKGGLEFGRKRSRQLAERPATLPELVSSYRDFAEEVGIWLNHNRDGARLLVCIDEVDRIAKAEDAEAFVNEVKAIFGVRYCRYLVTVSEDALAGFERRVIGVRPSLDSAFDEVLRLEPFTAVQSLDLLRRHVVGFPDIYIVLCHCLGGGLPRDLVREARALLDENRNLKREDGPSTTQSKERKASNNLNALTEAIVSREIQTLKRGLVNRIRGVAETDARRRLLSKLADQQWPGRSTQEVLDSLEQLCGAEEDVLDLGLEVASAIYFYTTVRDVFIERTASIGLVGRSRSLRGRWVTDGNVGLPEESERRVRRGKGQRGGSSKFEIPPFLDDLARVRSLLPTSSIVAIREIDMIRKSLQLPVLVHKLSA